MSQQGKLFWRYFQSGAFGWIFVMLFIASIGGYSSVDWGKWWLLTVVLVIAPNALLSLAFAYLTAEGENK